MPRFKCLSQEVADLAMMKYIYNDIKYPFDAREKDIQGKVIVSFTVLEDGSISDIVCYRGICQSMKKECLRIVSAMPKWCPGEQDGKAVKVSYNLPIRFRLD